MQKIVYLGVVGEIFVDVWGFYFRQNVVPNHDYGGLSHKPSFL